MPHGYTNMSLYLEYQLRDTDLLRHFQRTLKRLLFSKL